MSTTGSTPRLVVYGRRDCSLCEEMVVAAKHFAGPALPVGYCDVDADPRLARRFGPDVPVLCLDGEVVCCHFLDEARLATALGR